MKVRESNGEPRSVFRDEKGRRGRFFSYVGMIVGGVITVFLAFFVVSVLINPFLPQIKLRPVATLPQQSDILPHTPELPLTKRQAAAKQIGDTARIERKHHDEERLEKIAAAEMKRAGSGVPDGQRPHDGKPLAIGFLVNWDDSSVASLKQNINNLDWVVPEWIRLSGDTNNPLVFDVSDAAIEIIRNNRPDLPVLPLIQNYKNEQWNSDILVRSISTDVARKRLISSILQAVDKYKFGGVTIDIEEVPAASQSELFVFMTELRRQFHERGLILAQAVPFDNPDWNYKAYAGVTDYLMLMAYDQHWSTGEAGPVSGEDWYETTLKKRMASLLSFVQL